MKMKLGPIDLGYFSLIYMAYFWPMAMFHGKMLDYQSIQATRRSEDVRTFTYIHLVHGKR